MKKFWSLVVAVLLLTALVAAFSTTAYAEGDYSWSYDSATKTLTIGPDETGWIGTASTAASYRYPWESEVALAEVEHLVVEEGTLYLGKFVMGRLKTSLVDISLPSTLKIVYPYNFYQCTGLQSIDYAGSPEMFAEVEVYSTSNSAYNAALVNATGLSGDCSAAEANVSYFLNKNTGVLTFSGTGAMAEFSQRGTPWYDYASSIKSVDIGNGITTIGKWSLAYLSEMTELSVPFTMQTVGAYSLANTSKLANIYYAGSPASYGKIEVYDHTYTANFKNTPVSYGSQDVINGTISGSNLTWSVDLASGLLTVEGDGAFPDLARKADAPWFDCADFITSLYIGDGVTSLGVRSFTALRNITSVSLPASLTYVANISFGNAWKIETVEYRGSVAQLGGLEIHISYNTPLINAYYSCTGTSAETVVGGSMGMTEWSFDTTTGTLTISGTGAMPAYGAKSSIPWYAYRQFITDIVVEEGVTAVGKWAFGALENIESVTLPCTVKNVNAYAFANAAKLSVYNYSGSTASYSITVDDIYNSYFSALTPAYGTDDVYSETVGNITWTIDFAAKSLTVEGEGAIEDYAKKYNTPWNVFAVDIKTLAIGDGITSLGKWSFGSLSLLTSVELPASVTHIGDRAFANSRKLATVTFNGTEEQYNAIVIDGIYNENFTNVTPEFVETEPPAEPDATTYTLKADGTYELTKYVITDGLDVKIPLAYNGKAVTSIADNVFAGMPITSVIIPCSVETIGASAFEGCTALTSVKVLSGTPEISADMLLDIYENSGAQTTEELQGLIALAQSDNLAAIGDRAFYGCSALSSLTLPDKAITIGADAFAGTAFEQ